MDNPLKHGVTMGILLVTIASLGSGCSLPGAGPSPPNLVAKLTGHGLWVNSVTWSPDGTRVASGSSDRTARVWDVNSGRELATLTGFEGGVNVVAWSPDGRYLATGSAEWHNPLRVWDTAHWQAVFSIDPAPVKTADRYFNLDSLSWSPDSKYLAAGLEAVTTTGGPVDSWVKVFAAGAWHIAASLPHPDRVTSVTWSPDGKELVFGSSVSPGRLSSTVVAWTPFGPEGPSANPIILAVQDDLVSTLTWSPNGALLATNSDEAVKVWDIASKRNTITLSGNSDTVPSVAWSPTGNYIAAGSWDRTAKVWDVNTGRNVATFRHGDLVNSVAWSPNGKLLATGSADHNVYIWSVK
jgi:WD40 repeat protein